LAEQHIPESELAGLDDDFNQADHLSWCRACQNTAAEYRWIQSELEAGMREQVAQVPVPRSNWRFVASRVGATRRRVVLVRCGSLVVSILLMVCALAVTSSLPGVATSEAGVVSLVPVPQPIAAETRWMVPAVVATPGRQSSTAEPDGDVTPAVVPLPTPPVNAGLW